MKTGRNDPCHCGSGKKFKDCHGTKGAPNPWTKVILYGGIAVIALWLINNFFSDNKSTVRNAPPGKVWSEEHGHYHDIQTNLPPVPDMPPGVQQKVNIPQPEGPVPEGKVWSKEHGHWHDIVQDKKE